MVERGVSTAPRRLCFKFTPSGLRCLTFRLGVSLSRSGIGCCAHGENIPTDASRILLEDVAVPKPRSPRRPSGTCSAPLRRLHLEPGTASAQTASPSCTRRVCPARPLEEEAALGRVEPVPYHRRKPSAQRKAHAPIQFDRALVGSRHRQTAVRTASLRH